MNYNSICELCLEASEKWLEIFGEKGLRENIAKIVKQHFWFEIKDAKNQKQILCVKCWQNVKHFNDFYNLVKRKHNETNLSQDNSLLHCNFNPQHDLKDSKIFVTDVKVEPPSDEFISVEGSAAFNAVYLEDAMQDDGNTSDELSSSPKSDYSPPKKTPLTKRRKNKAVELKIEPPDLDLINKFFKMDCGVCRQSFESYEHIKEHYSQEHKSIKFHLYCCEKKFYRPTQMTKHCELHRNPATTVGQLFECTVCAKAFPKQHLLNAHVRNAHKVNKVAKNKKPDYTSENEIIKKRFIMQCDLCPQQFETFQEAKLHHPLKHGQSGYLRCCNRKFFRLNRAIQHCAWHDNPESFKCELCHKCFWDNLRLQEHMENIHTPAEQRDFKCDICEKSFKKKHMLSAHKRVNHLKNEDKKFECHICGQRFINLHFLRRHVDRVHHNIYSFKCNVCAKAFKSAKACDMHYLTEHTDVEQKIQCEKCGKWLKHQDSLNKHLALHNSTSKNFNPFQRVSTNIPVHLEATLPCTVCNKMFKKKRTLKEHMAIHAGIKDLYSCSFCTRTFRSSANMYAHRKRTHPVEYELSKSSTSSYAKT